MTESLHRMLSKANVEAKVFEYGVNSLRSVPPSFLQFVYDLSKGDLTSKGALKYFARELPQFLSFVNQLRRFDVVVVVNSIPEAYMRNFFRDDVLWAFLPGKPIVLHDVFYLPTRGPWAKWLKEGNPDSGIPSAGNWGLERYDWYLCASVVSECALPSSHQPVSVIGMNLEDPRLAIESKREFVALIDFEQPHHLHERALQVLACKNSNTHFISLHGHYSTNKIREIYRKCSMYFVAHRESFGIPVCELQACGSYVFTPYSDWCPSHWLKDPTREGPGVLSPNFVVYDNELEILVDEIRRVKATHDPSEVQRTFQKYHPQFMYGGMDELRKFVRMVEEGRIHSQSHKEYADLKAPEVSAAASVGWNLNNSSHQL
jgi:hypothetical protein